MTIEYKRKKRELPNFDKRIDAELEISDVPFKDDGNGIIS
jgi:hypothetical protein